MATDYDAPRDTEASRETDGVEEIQAHRAAKAADVILLGEGDFEPIDAPGAVLVEEPLTVEVVPRQGNEFLCSGCFLVYHLSRMGRTKRGKEYCVDCG